MAETYIFEGNTTNSAIEKGLRELKVTKNDVEVKVLEENKKSFFSILAPRIVKVEITLKKGSKENNVKREINVSQEDINNQIEFLKEYLEKFIKNATLENIDLSIENEENYIKVDLNGENLKCLIGYRGETLKSLEIILNAVSKNNGFLLRILCNINNFKEKRIESLNELAEKVSKTVLRTGRNVTLEPMQPYERKAIHDKLQNSDRIKTFSVGEGSNRRVVIALK